jgi:hypothetical protein
MTNDEWDGGRQNREDNAERSTPMDREQASNIQCPMKKRKGQLLTADDCGL